MARLTNAQLERIHYRLSASKVVDMAMFPGSFGTYYAQDVEVLLEELQALSNEPDGDGLIDYEDVPETTIIGA